MAKQKILNQIGWQIRGTVDVTFWDCDKGRLEMDKRDILFGQMTKENLLGCINDGQFGVMSIDSAFLEVYDLYEESVTDFNREIEISNPEYLKLACRGIKIRKTTIV